VRPDAVLLQGPAATAALISGGTPYMHYLNSSVFITPAWIILGGLGVLFARKWLSVYLLSCVLLATVSWLSGVAQVRKQRSFDEREQAVETGQQELNAEFDKLATALRIPANSPHEMILNRMQAMDAEQGRTAPAPAPIKSPIQSEANCQPRAGKSLYDAAATSQKKK
jgi:hypothetical protein